MSESRLGLGLGCWKPITAEAGAAALTAYPEEVFKLLGQVTIRRVVRLFLGREGKTGEVAPVCRHADKYAPLWRIPRPLADIN